jgi:hypothetical protein
MLTYVGVRPDNTDWVTVMFGIMGKEKKKEKAAELLVQLMRSYSNACVNDICEKLNSSPFDNSVRKLIETDDSYQFWYSVGLGLSWARGFDDNMATVIGTRTLMEFLNIPDVRAIYRGIELHRTGEEKINKGICDRNSKVQHAAATVVLDLKKNSNPTTLSLCSYVTFICKIDGYGMTFEEMDKILEE